MNECIVSLIVKISKNIKYGNLAFVNEQTLYIDASISIYLCRKVSAQKVSAQKVSGHKVSKIDNIGQKVSSQNYQNKDNEHYYFSYNIFNSVVGSKANRN